jgi:hypothetical protein
VEKLPSFRANAANGAGLLVTGYTVTNVTITDSRRRKQTHFIPFVVARLARYKMYLGLLWIDSCHLKLNYASRRLLFRGNKVKDQPRHEQVILEDAEQFENTLHNPLADVYACTVGYLGQVEPIQDQEHQIPPQYAEFADLRSKDKAQTLPEHSSHDLAINLKEGTQPLYKPLYNLSASELEVLRKYIANYIARG